MAYFTVSMLITRILQQVSPVEPTPRAKEPPAADLKLFEQNRATLSAHLGWCSVEAGWTIRYKIFDDAVACSSRLLMLT